MVSLEYACSRIRYSYIQRQQGNIGITVVNIVYYGDGCFAGTILLLDGLGASRIFLNLHTHFLSLSLLGRQSLDSELDLARSFVGHKRSLLGPM